jgi:translation elongation factor EF-Tu-like GTPase
MTKPAGIAIFKIETSFFLTGRGLVAIGQIVDGIVSVGAYTTLQVADTKEILQISGVEMVDVKIVD